MSNFYLMFFISSFRAGSSGLQPRHPPPTRAMGPCWSLELGRTWGHRAGSWTWVWRNVLLCVLQKWNFPFVENSTSLIFFFPPNSEEYFWYEKFCLDWKFPLPPMLRGKCSVFPADRWQSRKEGLIFLNSTPELCSWSHTATARLLFG